MESLTTIQQNTLSVIRKAGTNFKKTGKSRMTKSYIKVRIETLNSHWDTFKQTHSEILKIATSEEIQKHDYFTEDWFSMGEEEFIEIKAEMIEKIEKFNLNETSSQSPSTSQEVKLPKIDIPRFNGDYNEWPTFQDLYKSLIHNNNTLSEVQKLHYLKCSVTGEAEQLLKHIQVTEKNYQIAWTILKQRFNNKRVIVNAIFNRFLGQKKLSIESAQEIKELLDTTTECVNNLQNQDIDVTNWDPILIHLIVDKLDQNSHKLWEEELNDLPIEDLPTLKKLNKFLEGRFRVLEIVHYNQSKEKLSVKSKSFVTSSTSSNTACAYCKESHLIFYCKEFANLDPNERSGFVQAQRLCFNRLWPGHSVKFCRHNTVCRRCNRKHHTLLHSSKPNSEELNSNTVATSNREEEEKTMQVQNTFSHVSIQGQAGLLATALVNIQTGRGLQVVRALIDPCSHESFISEATVQRLQLKKKSIQGNVCGLGKTSTQFKHAAEIEISSRFDKNYKLNCTAYIVKEVTDLMPITRVNCENWTQFNNLVLADPTYQSPGPIDLLLGVNIHSRILLSGLIKGNPNTPIAQQTELGWIISGGETRKASEILTTSVSMHLNVSLDHMLQRFWDSETLEENKPNTQTPTEVRAEEIYEKTVQRDEEGRYIVSIPFNKEVPVIPENSREIALNRLKSLEKKLEKNEPLRKEYNRVLKEYLALQHMEPVDINIDSKAVYLPHHAVVREDKDTTKVRVVFDASCKGSNGVSLNDEMLVGPALQEELRDIILRWRKYRVAFISDIIKMYRQIKINMKDVDYQRIVWRFDTKDQVADYRLLTVTFGTASAPYLAIKTLRQVAKDEGENFPIASKIVNNDCYMDDVMSGCDDEDTAIEAYRQLTEMLEKGKFELQKWSSNSTRFMKEIEREKREDAADIIMNRKDIIKTLGIVWEVKDDKLKLIQKVESSKTNGKITKRRVLSQIASLFDPMGWLAPAVIVSKIIMQKLWSRQLEWDESLPKDLEEEWQKYHDEIMELSDLKLSRWIRTAREDQVVQLHGFSDASMSAYAAVIYCRVENPNGEVTVSLIMAKTKVAPLKQQTLPRLELCAAVLLSKLLKHVANVMEIEISNTYAWSDSQVTLAWIKGDPNRWTPFVKNRVIDIQNTINTQWLYINTKENPADPASRGIMPHKLKDCKLWWEGPEFLQQTKLVIAPKYVPETNLETRKSTTLLIDNFTVKEHDEYITLLTKYSSLKKLLNVIAYCKRWLNIIKGNRNLPAYITCEEREKALTLCIMMTQEIEFPEEISNLKKKKNIKKSSRLLPFNPYLDAEGVLRVGGRLKHADMETVRKHPIIITKDNVLLPILLDEAHKRTLHGGPQLMTSYLRSKYWIIKGGQSIKRFYRLCKICTRYNAQTRHQQMGNLPDVRVNPGRPFLTSGVDFAGPIFCRMSKGRGAKAYKAYICLFICMVTKAIHLELVSDMTTDAFMASFKRFISRRGHCQELWSDHGTTFVAAEKELLEMWKQGQNELPDDLKKLLDARDTRWKYIPPGSPNFGGLWEAGVKSTKYHLKRIVGESTLTFEELYTVLTQIEACLNSRPLAPLGDELDFLTPAHFLVGEPTVVIPDRNYDTTRIPSITRWQVIQRMVQDFWKRWQSEYLSRLQERSKWQTVQRELNIGDIVLVKDSRLPPASWKLGRIEKKYPGSDGLTRTYDIRTKSNIIQRSITNICPLHADN